ncbi:endopeptidase [Herbaspirillum sp. RTI4]|uniref:Bbp19 family protein n=1 Tax=Herbaspirillum sp. RTI4 TaxID=3048640 RepID=UPI002AB3AF3E|nr:endopeptidase [Herbaspirillum sp. RTI4]MDY7579359.1 endopeptidase [Herbaspirillum sp. RTI4]MEA9980273.1 endopeptidase [Herbaspirillum sp. RTI4]
MIDPLNTEANDELRKARASMDSLAKHKDAEDIKWLMSSKRGRRIVNGLLQNAGVFRLSFHTNALQMSFNEGNRNTGLMLLAAITEQCPERYAEMIEEAKQ